MRDAAFDEQSESFMRWLSSRPGVFISPKIALENYTEYNGGRGLSAVEALSPDDLLFTVPRHTLLSWQNSTLRDKLQFDDEQTGRLGDWNLLILSLLYENSMPDSKWAEYLSILPDSFSTPMFWSSEELSELQGSTLSEKIGREEADQSYHDLILPIILAYPQLFDITRCGLEQFHRMGSLIMAYSFDAPIETTSSEDQADDNDSNDEEEEEQSEKVMCPLADLLNADTQLNNARLYYLPDRLEMRCIKQITEGEQIYNTYGELPNSDLLRRYGYIQAQNPHDIVELPGDVITSLFPLSDAEKEERVDWLLDMELLDDTFEVTQSGKVPSQVMVTMDVLSMTLLDFDRLKSEEIDVPRGKKTATMQNLVSRALRAQLEKYSSTIEQDEEILQRSEVSYNKRNAVAVRLGEKNILRRALDLVMAWDMQETSSRKRSNDARREDGNKKSRAQ
ncbi:protein of unknown function [Taphrina deformans PYCC 5710]|uniref:SET domain-containing protein n=1 Tax=Taphrina deformans (strain PYCC 5710 / ATCC 11124 / CBS 356.35 / IMI 108563 / JCM 9778 / NBRC 8474) TaxID=1097556 RepID=R4XFB2_TAPDE|nr:protein of unknown function [Taphrina deformans PYCC 5710]|eukprot:CCG84562.1 protein of unknown function [Taphrina deformans PYCC 5710]